jgi:hypothetical protein
VTEETGGSVDAGIRGVGDGRVAGAGGFRFMTAGVMAGDLPSALVVLPAVGLTCGTGVGDGRDGSWAGLISSIFGFVTIVDAGGAGLGLAFAGAPNFNLIGAAADFGSALVARFSFKDGCGGSSTLALASATRSLK